MQYILNEPEPDAWPQIAPLLDQAMEQLGKKEHDAIVLRFFEGRNFKEVGAALGASEDTARMRVNRALEKLRKFFTKRGVVSTTAIIAWAISANSVQAAPVALAKSVTAVAIAKGAAASGSTLTLIKGALKIMAWTKAKTAVVVSVGVLLTAGTTTVVVSRFASAAVDESLWEMKLENLKIAPSVLIIRPTRYSGSGMMTEAPAPKEGKVIMHRADFAGLLMEAYASREFRMIMPANVPRGWFDLMLTLPDHQQEALQKAIQRSLASPPGAKPVKPMCSC